MEKLPSIVQIKIIKMLHLSDIENLMIVSRHFQSLIAKELDSWLKNAPLIKFDLHERSFPGLRWLAGIGNIEATIKLAIVLPYRYRCRADSIGPVIMMRTALSAKLFQSIESTGQLKYPLTWIFLRPPWSSAIPCRKRKVYEVLTSLVNYLPSSANLCYCIAMIQMLCPEEEKGMQSMYWLHRACSQGSLDARFRLWQHRLCDATKDIRLSVEIQYSMLQMGNRLDLIRSLRSLAFAKYEPAELQLCRLYARGHHEGVSTAKAYRTVSRFFSKSKPHCDRPFRLAQSDVTAPMRRSLIDWLTELATLKELCNATVHVVVQCMDRYLALKHVARGRLQLLGIACIVLCSRYMEKNMLTIREALLYAKSLHKYNDVVELIGDIVSTLRGNIQGMTVIDYFDVLRMMPKIINNEVEFTSRIIADSTIFYADAGLHPPALVACCCVLLGNLAEQPEMDAWNVEMQELTGFSVQDLQSTTLELHNKCIATETPVYPSNQLQADSLQQLTTPNPIVTHDRLVEFFENNRAPVINHDDDEVGEHEKSVSEYPPHSAVHCLSSYQASCADSQSSDADTPPTASSAYARHSDIKTRKRIEPGEELASNASPLLSRNGDEAPTVANRETEKVRNRRRHNARTNNSYTRGRGSSAENGGRNTYEQTTRNSAAAQISRDSYLPASKSIRLMR